MNQNFENKIWVKLLFSTSVIPTNQEKKKQCSYEISKHNKYTLYTLYDDNITHFCGIHMQ